MAAIDDYKVWRQNLTDKERFGNPYLRDSIKDAPDLTVADVTPNKWDLGKILKAPSALLADIFTPKTEESKNLPYWERAITEYEQWNAPWIVKTGIDFLPSLIPVGGAANIGRMALTGVGKAAAKGLAKSAVKKTSSQLIKEVAEQAAKQTAEKATLGKASTKSILKRLGKNEYIYGTPQPTTPENMTSLKKLESLIEQSAKRREEVATIKSAELGRRVSVGTERLAGGEGEAGFKNAISALGGKYETGTTTKLFEEVRSKVTQTDIDNISNIIRDFKVEPIEYSLLTKVPAFEGLQKMMLGEVVQQSELSAMEKILGPGLVRAYQKKLPLGKRILENIMNVMNAPRSLLASMDLSHLLNQGGIATLTSPGMALTTLKPTLKAMFSKDYHQIVDDIIRTTKDVDRRIMDKLYIAPSVGRETTALSEMEEAFMSKFMSKLPGVQQSNQAYVTGLNLLRFGKAKDFQNLAEKAGLEITDLDASEIAKYINMMTGRGEIPKAFSSLSPFLSTLFFSPRMILSRLQLPTKLLSSSKIVRQQAWKDMFQFAGTVGGLLTAAELTGIGTVEDNPLSSDYGKLKIGNTRWDLWSGYTQYIRFINQITEGQRKTTGTGNIVSSNRKDILDRFIRSKSSPALGLMYDVLTGQTYMGEELSMEGGFLASQAMERLLPFSVQSMIEAYESDGPLGTALAAPSILGVGLSSYTQTPEQQFEEEKAYAYNDIEMKVWASYPPTYRDLADQYDKLKETDIYAANKLLRENPGLVMAMKVITLQKRSWLKQNKGTIG